MQYFTKTIGDKELELGIDIQPCTLGGLEEEPCGETMEILSAKFDGNDIYHLLENEHLYFAFEQIANELTK